MRLVTLCSAAVCATLLASGNVQAQAFRYIPLPRPPAGGGFHVPLHLPWHGGGEQVFWIIVAVVGVSLAVSVGWELGHALGGGGVRSPEATGASWQQATTRPVPPPDLILSPAAVQEKACETTRLLEALARRDKAFDPPGLRLLIAATFSLVQKSWQGRDPGPLQELLTPSLLAQFEELVGAMRRDQVISRSEGLQLTRLEFVHVSYPAEADLHEITALLTFDARAYFVHERTGAFQQGSRLLLPYQEFWVFCRQGAAWRLHAVEGSHLSDRLRAPNRVAHMTTEDLGTAEEGVSALPAGSAGSR